MTSGPTEVVTREEVLGYLRETIARVLEIDVSEASESTQLYLLPNVDSLKTLRALTEAERKYGITVDLGQVFVSRTIGDVADMIVATIQEQRS